MYLVLYYVVKDAVIMRMLQLQLHLPSPIASSRGHFSKGSPFPFWVSFPFPFAARASLLWTLAATAVNTLGGGGTLDLLLLPAPSSARRKKDCLKTSLPLVIICQLRQSNNLSREHLFLSCRALFFSCVPELFQCSLLYSIFCRSSHCPILCPSSPSLFACT